MALFGCVGVILSVRPSARNLVYLRVVLIMYIDSNEQQQIAKIDARPGGRPAKDYLFSSAKKRERKKNACLVWRLFTPPRSN